MEKFQLFANRLIYDFDVPDVASTFDLLANKGEKLSKEEAKADEKITQGEGMFAKILNAFNPIRRTEQQIRANEQAIAELNLQRRDAYGIITRDLLRQVQALNSANATLISRLPSDMQEKYRNNGTGFCQEDKDKIADSVTKIEEARKVLDTDMVARSFQAQGQTPEQAMANARQAIEQRDAIAARKEKEASTRIVMK